MKNLICFMFFVSIYSCATESQHKEDLLNTIATDPLYFDFQSYIELSATKILDKSFDLNAIHNYLDNHNVQDNYCNVVIDEKFEIKGLSEYLQIHCDMDIARGKLVEKFPVFDKLSKDQIRSINKVYRENNRIDILKTQ